MAMNATGTSYIVDSSAGLIRAVSATGIVSTIAGNHNFGFLGSNGTPASASELSTLATYSTFDSQGNFYFSDTNNARVRKIDLSGNISTVAGNGSGTYSGDGGPAAAASLNAPKGLVFDSSGNLYIADTNNNRIRQVNPNGIITTVVGTGVAGSTGDGGPSSNAELNAPEGIAIDSAGNGYVTESSGHRVRMISPSGYISTVAGTGVAGFSGDNGPATAATINSPAGVAVDAAGNVFVSDRSNFRVRKITASTGIISEGPVRAPTALAAMAAWPPARPSARCASSSSMPPATSIWATAATTGFARWLAWVR